MGKARYTATVIPLKGADVKIYASPRVSEAIAELVPAMNLYQGVRFTQVVQAVYEQGKKDGARLAFEAIDAQVREARKAVPHRLPGRPRKT